jgi:hypothetical protein
MNKKLRATVERLALEFAEDLLQAIRSAPVEEILAGVTGKLSATTGARGRPGKPATGGRRVRRSSGDIEKTADAIVALLKAHRSGLRSEEIQAKLGVARAELPRPIADALREKRIVKTGQKRATTYFAR